jgi:hypothetical protein
VEPVGAANNLSKTVRDLSNRQFNLDLKPKNQIIDFIAIHHNSVLKDFCPKKPRSVFLH